MLFCASKGSTGVVVVFACTKLAHYMCRSQNHISRIVALRKHVRTTRDVARPEKGGEP